MAAMFFVIDSNASRSPQWQERVWQHLWELRDVLPVSVVLPTLVTSPCPLLADERAGTVLSATLLQVPQGSAWIPMQIDVSQFARRNGDIRLQALEAVLQECVDSGDKLHDSTSWFTSTMEYDSWLNRRLAIAVRGWGCLVRLRGDDPRAFRTLRDLQGLADFVNSTLLSRSRALAKERGHCPALDVAGTRIAHSGAEMKARWQRAVDDNALRHRNLTTMSPWDVFPARQPAEARYFDLLPLMRCANSLSFQREVDISHWSPGEFRGFFDRVNAILRSGNDAGLIAKQV